MLKLFLKARIAIITIIALMIVVVDFRMFFMSVLADAMLVALLLVVLYKFPSDKKE